MKKVYQRIDADTSSDPNVMGDCMVAAVATLLQIKYEEVPHFVMEKDWHKALRDFMLKHGYKWVSEILNPRALGFMGTHSMKESIQKFNGVNGLFLAVVYSPKYVDIRKDDIGVHQVICDKELNIVFDPKPEYKNLESYPAAKRIGCNGIISVDIFEKLKQIEL